MMISPPETLEHAFAGITNRFRRSHARESPRVARRRLCVGPPWHRLDGRRRPPTHERPGPRPVPGRQAPLLLPRECGAQLMLSRRSPRCCSGRNRKRLPASSQALGRLASGVLKPVLSQTEQPELRGGGRGSTDAVDRARVALYRKGDTRTGQDGGGLASSPFEVQDRRCVGVSPLSFSPRRYAAATAWAWLCTHQGRTASRCSRRRL